MNIEQELCSCCSLNFSRNLGESSLSFGNLWGVTGLRNFCCTYFLCSNDYRYLYFTNKKTRSRAALQSFRISYPSNYLYHLSSKYLTDSFNLQTALYLAWFNYSVNGHTDIFSLEKNESLTKIFPHRIFTQHAFRLISYYLCNAPRKLIDIVSFISNHELISYHNNF